MKQVPISKRILEYIVHHEPRAVSTALGIPLSMVEAIQGGKKLTCTPLELAAMESIMSGMLRVRTRYGAKPWFTMDRLVGVRHAAMIKETAAYVSNSWPLLKKYRDGVRRQGKKRAQIFRQLSMYAPIYTFWDCMLKDTLPFLLRLWDEYPGHRKLLFQDTGFENVVNEIRSPSK